MQKNTVIISVRLLLRCWFENYKVKSAHPVNLALPQQLPKAKSKRTKPVRILENEFT